MTNFYVANYHKSGYSFNKDNLPKSAEEAMEQSGLNWGVRSEKLYLKDGSEVPNSFCIQRSDNSHILGVVGSRYSALQNVDAFNFMDELVKEGIVSYDAAGETKDGSRVWLRMKMEDTVSVSDKDKVGKYLVLTNTHDGTGSVRIFITPFRFICSNALAYSWKRSEEKFSVRHTSNVFDKTKIAVGAIESVNEAYKELEKTWKKMANFQLPPERIEDYFVNLFPDSEGKKNKGLETRTNLYRYLSSGKGSELGINNTLWGVYNAVTEHLSHDMSARKGSTEAKHFDSLMFGERAKKNEQAMNLALEMMKQ